MKKIIEYQVSCENCPTKLAKHVNQAIKAGYSPYGNISTVGYKDENTEQIWFSQPMVKYEEEFGGQE